MELPIMNVAMITRLFVSCEFPGVQCGKAYWGKVFEVFVHLFQQMNCLGLSDQRLVDREA